MFVKNRMATNPYTISSHDTITDAYEMMSQHKIKRLPVVDNGKLVGIITSRELQQVTPSKATSLSIYEINYLLSKTTVGSVMTKELITVSPDALLEEAAVLMRDNGIGALPVLEGDKLVGIITETEVFDSFIDLLGFRDPGSRITVEAQDIPGALSDLASIFGSFGVNVSHVAVYKGSGITCDVVLRINSTNTAEIEKALTAHGFRIVHILKNE